MEFIQKFFSSIYFSDNFLIRLFFLIESWFIENIFYYFNNDNGSIFIGLIFLILFIIGNIAFLYFLGFWILFFSLIILYVPYLIIHPSLFILHCRILNWYGFIGFNSNEGFLKGTYDDKSEDKEDA